MNIKKTIITATVALTMVAMIAPMTAGAATIADLQAQINALMAQLQGLQGTPSGVPAACVVNGVTINFTRNLTVGSTGQDVRCFQALMNTHGYQLAVSGAGSPGNETMYFGPLTLASVRRLQVAQGWTPANQVGPMTRALFNSWLAGGVVVLPPTSTGPVSAMLSTDNPAAGSIVGGQATADLMHVTFMGSGTVTSVTLKRTGISDQNTLTNVYLFDGNTRITDGYSFNVNGDIVINSLSIAVNGSHTISVRADVAASAATTASTLAVSLTSYTANGSANTVNVMGNTMFIVVGNLASAYLGANTVYNSNTAVNINAGTTQYTVWSAPVQINTRAIWLKMANFKMVGSAPSNALSNIRLFVDGVDTGKIATVMSINGSNYATFDLTAAPISLMTGSHTVEVRADIFTGAARTVQLSVQQASDLNIYDPQIGVNIAVLGASGATFSTNTGANININQGSGSVVVDPAFTSQTNISAGATNAVIGKFVIHGYGEDVKITSLQVTPTLTSLESDTCTLTAVTTAQSVTCTSTSGFIAGNAIISSGNSAVGVVNSITSTTVMSVTFASAPTAASQTVTVQDKGLNNVTVYFNGSQVGSQQSPTASGSALTFQLGNQIAPAGQDSTVEVRADLQQQSTSTAYGSGTIASTLVGQTTANAVGQSSQNSVKIPDTTSVSTTGLSIQSALLVVSKNTAYASQTVSPNSPSSVKIGSFIVQNQSTSESIRLTTLTVNLTSNGTTALTTTELTGLSNLKTSDTTGSGSNPIAPAASNTFSVSDVLAPGAQMTLDIWANTGSATALPQVITRLTVASIGVSSNISSAGTITTGQTMTLGAGTISATTGVTLLSSPTSTTPPSFVTGGVANASQATFKFVATSATAKITELKFFVSDGSTGSVTNVCVTTTPATDATGTAHTVCTTPQSGTAWLQGLNLVVPTGSGLSQVVQVSYAPVGLNQQLTPNTVSQLKIAYVNYISGGTPAALCDSAVVSCSGTSFTAITAPTSTGAIHIVSSVPAVTVVSTTGASLNATTSGTTDAGRVTISGGANGIKLRQLTFNVGFSGYSSAPTITQDATSSFLKVGSTIVAPCSVSSTTVTCRFTSNGVYATSPAYANDFDIAANTSTTFDLFTSLSAAGTAGTGSQYENVTLAKSTTALSSDGMLWDDTSTAGAANTVVNAVPSSLLSDFFINDFPTNSTSVHN